MRVACRLSVRRLRRGTKIKMAAEVNNMDELSFDVVAVLPAGGCGVRMNMKLPKQVDNEKITLINTYLIYQMSLPGNWWLNIISFKIP